MKRSEMVKGIGEILNWIYNCDNPKELEGSIITGECVLLLIEEAGMFPPTWNDEEGVLVFGWEPEGEVEDRSEERT